MMNKLFVFGDSYSAHYNLINKYFVDYVNFLNGEPLPEIWPVLLSKKLNLKLENTGIGGYCNYSIFQDFSINSHKINENDTVVIGWSFLERFRLFDEKNAKFINFVPQFKDNRVFENLTKNTIEEIFYNRSHDYWVNEVRSWENLILRLQKLINFKLIIWSFDDRLSNEKKNLHFTFSEMGGETIKEETKGVVDDGHYGKKGHIVQNKYFYEKIIRMDSSNYIRL